MKVRASFWIAVLLGAALFGSAAPAAVRAADCSRTSVGFTPLNDLGAGGYQGEAGGLYPGGLNVPPERHRQVALDEAAGVRPLDRTGAPADGGRIVLLSVGMSNATQEFSEFMRVARDDPAMSPRMLLVDGAQGGQTAAIVRDPNARYWQVLDGRLQQAGSSREQVQIIWLKEANARPTDPFPGHARALQQDLEEIVHTAYYRFPNLKFIYLASRIYGGYASTVLNPEPYAYESAFAVRWLITQQIDGEPDLNADPAQGPVLSPVLLWGPYLWADGLEPRRDGLTWRCEDFAEDGTHPSGSGRQKVARQLLEFLKTDETARGWFLASGIASPTPAGSTATPAEPTPTPPRPTASPRPPSATPSPPPATPTAGPAERVCYLPSLAKE
jgi:hypothetical protein